MLIKQRHTSRGAGGVRLFWHEQVTMFFTRNSRKEFVVHYFQYFAMNLSQEESSISKIFLPKCAKWNEIYIHVCTVPLHVCQRILVLLNCLPMSSFIPLTGKRCYFSYRLTVHACCFIVSILFTVNIFQCGLVTLKHYQAQYDGRLTCNCRDSSSEMVFLIVRVCTKTHEVLLKII